MARERDDGERTCLVTREAQPPEGLIRFVADPAGRVMPDLRERLPGRGAWVGCRRDLVETAVRKRLFARALRTEVEIDPDLPATLDRMLEEAALSSLSMARKAGQAIAGFGKVTTALAGGGVLAVIHAAEAADDGRRKVGQAIRRRAAMVAEMGPEGAVAPHVVVIEGIFGLPQLDLAFGGANVIHAALLAGGASKSFLTRAEMLARYRGRHLDASEGSPDSGDDREPV
ncbi:RNA-binding protein [Methylobrevis pamukkalensis]|uniref:YlxR domain-containing protein n=1 Tax=Methylobrevis pamukkalensis TaxID=1439726 RepID=A0A1E3H776_9HYPH|nr:RNA-binding protein [Methylobrevis pamukkalensis]ODN72154.1 hypothetical protein A6302_00558 [Methylobrevis pamukkalensis]